RLVYGILLGVMTVILGALLIGFTFEIYNGGSDGLSVFSREKVGKQLMRLLPAIVIWIVMVAAGFVLWEVFPEPKKKLKPDVRYTLYRLKKRMPRTVEGDLQNSLNAVKHEELILKILWLAAGVLCLGAAIYTIVYLATPSNFPAVENLSVPVYDMVKHVMPCVAAAFAVCLGVAVYEGVSAKRQLKEVTTLTRGIKEVQPKPNKIRVWLEAKSESSKFFAFLLKTFDFNVKHRVLILRVIVGCLGVAFVIAGIFNGSMREVFTKAIAICTECIGLG
ncbi:MAG: hypothetical protein K2O41_02735, partial [Clostridia bacterium]|nr:hypothetical protein [Clostridia bacterium]